MSTSYHGLTEGITSKNEWRLLGALALAAFVLGWMGFMEYKTPHGSASLWGAAYHSLQMLILHTPHLEAPIPLTLEIGRWMAVLVFFWAACKVIFAALRKDWQSVGILWKQKHLVICGLGYMGLPLALEAKRQGLDLVAIEKDPEAKGIREATGKGIPVVIGDASEKETLRRARVHKAEHLFAVCADDAANIGIAAIAGEFKSGASSSSKLQCWLFVGDPRLRAELREDNFFHCHGDDYRVNIRGLDVYAVRARTAFAKLPLGHLSLPVGSERRPRLVLVGFDEMGQHLALQAARIAHFPSGGMLRITVVDEYADEKVEAFRHNVSNLDKVAEIVPIKGKFEKSEVWSRVLKDYLDFPEREEELLAFAICHDRDDIRNLCLARKLARELPRGRAPVLVYLDSGNGFTHLMPAGELPSVGARLMPFGMLQNIWTLATLKDENQDVIARALHDVYCESLKRRRDAGEDIPMRPAEKPWEQLDETFRESSRAQTDHIPIKLHTIGLTQTPLSSRRTQPFPQLGPENIKMLSRMEHARWCAERWLAGWTLPPEGEDRNDAKKWHPDLVAWEDLLNKEKKIDKDLITEMFTVLQRTGYGIAPLSKGK